MRREKILIMTPVGRSPSGEYIDYFPSRWSGSTGMFKSTTFYPFNLAYLSTFLKLKTKHTIKFFDANYYGVDSDEYVDYVKKYDPNILIIEIDSIIEKKMLAIIKILKEFNTLLRIIVCGPSPSSNPNIFLDSGASYVAIGEFELSILNLIKSGFDEKTFGIYPNQREELIDLDMLPFPEDEDIKRRNYCRYYASEYNEVEVFSTRGCPHMCNFCVVANVYGGKPSFRVRKVSSVIEEIKYLKSSIPDLEGIFFNEESHTSNKSFIRELCLEIIRLGLTDIKYNCMTNYDTLDLDLLNLMKKAGYYKVRIGIESLDSDVSALITKTKIKSNHEKLMDILKIAKELDIKIYVTMSIGAVGSSKEKDLDSLKQLELLYDNDYIQEFQVSINTPMPGTPFYSIAKENKWIVESGKFDGAKFSTISYENYRADDIKEVFDIANELRAKILNKNREEKKIRYSSYDKDWCEPVYKLTQRKIGEYYHE
ncbi:B12-binding domain-containing radical SAM protein [Halarcobacter anaerophilus]|uniref:Radical SAM core domain-containing protein n=1 Tax=Halarcobacter anaerophilus TaxID=877500 RepID=A0A4Q0XX43_9BACT|nr:radical SAM protein [Halarcobacter anaerophilus]QDF30230.1 radical SAM protein [Halarcobacter anaerophilus]RXJ62210.1 hypothetical protein CRV06_10620 [Halarcobacter anaerophilus]